MTSIMCNGARSGNMEMQHDAGVELPPGFRFHPTDEELLSFYLAKKVNNPQFHAIKALIEVDLNKCEPWDLPEKAKVGENEWYFFSMRDRKYPTGMRTNRATEKGYWKATGKDREVVDSRRVAVGMKKTLVFYGGRAPKGLKTNWIMHEYRLESPFRVNAAQQPHRSREDEWVVCRVFQKMALGNKKPCMEADHVPYQLPNQGDNSPNPTVTDSDDCGTNCATTKSGYNCQDRFGEGHTSHVSALDATSVLPQWRPVPMAIPYTHYDYQSKPMATTILMDSLLPPQSMASHPLNPYDHCYIHAKEEPSFYTTSCKGEDEAQSSQRFNNLDYPWPGDVLYDHDFPIY